MANRDTTLELTVVYVSEDNGWVTATIPAFPGVISAGSSKDKARVHVLDALRMLLSTPAQQEVAIGEVERLHVELRQVDTREVGREL